MLAELLAEPEELSGPLEAVYHRLDEDFKTIDQCGSTACTAVVRKEGGERVLYVANVGDSRAVLSSDGKAVRMSYDHNCEDESEI